jgi:predicted ATP-dependent serine protease
VGAAHPAGVMTICDQIQSQEAKLLLIINGVFCFFSGRIISRFGSFANVRESHQAFISRSKTHIFGESIAREDGNS